MPGRDVPLGDGHEAGQPGLGRQQVVTAGIERALGHAVADGKDLAGGIEEELEVHGLHHPLGDRCEIAQTVRQAGVVDLQVAGMTPYGVSNGQGPGKHFGSDRVLAVGRELTGDVHEVVRPDLQLFETTDPFGKG